MNAQKPRAVTEEQIFDALRECYDPEIPVNVVDLGLIYDVQIADGRVAVRMTLTAPGCAMGGMIAQSVRNRLLKVDGVTEADVRIVWEPVWTPARMSPEAKSRLGFEA